MRRVLARKNYVLLHDDGTVHYPFTRYLTDSYTNPHTRELVAQGLEVFYRFCVAYKIDLLIRASEGKALSYRETQDLINLCFRPIDEIKSMTSKKLILLSSPKAKRAPNELPNSVEPNTARKRLHQIAGYLKFYNEVFLGPSVRSHVLREQLKHEYQKVEMQLKKAVGGTKQNHHLSIQSLPTEKYLKIVEEIFVRPETLFHTQGGNTSRTVMRDRAMALLACEGLRPGTLGNIALSDFRPNSGHLVIKDNRNRRRERINTGTPKLKMGDSTKVNHASETMITLWPFTVRAIQDYISTEREDVLAKRLANKSSGFLFLNNAGTPVKHRSTITTMFNNLGKRLKLLRMLDVDDDPYFYEQPKYDFYSYVLRHSAASFFLSQKCLEISQAQDGRRPHQYADVPDRVKDLMKLRFGWTVNSKMPELYAARALSDEAQVVLAEFHQNLMRQVDKLKQNNAGGRYDT
ncbi:hypothetical protein [Vibrio lentus]|uniref:hypothetical protein n=1 Tax=Vibrio lentus TaxID=136468 RepID=UPI000C828C36|nr:hypothetical protein [Vibrio lentus]PMG80644.1 hypothetical protein BCU86_01520 [Vibrio lentus]